MVSKLHSWWQKTRKNPMATTLIALLGVMIALIVINIVGYILNWDWTGLNGYATISTATEITSSPPKITRTIGYQGGKTLWDWLQLLIIPAVLAVGGYLFNFTVSKNEQEAVKQRDQTERDIASDNQREAALQAYIDKMSELLLDKRLRESKLEDEIRTIARVRTLTVLPRLDSTRKGSVLQFLQESGLIVKDQPIIELSRAELSGADLSVADLSEADLRGANLNQADLRGANLSGADLNRAHLSRANLNGADLCRANLSRAVLRETDLSGADLSEANMSGAKITTEQLHTTKSLKGATMRDGSKHS